MNTLIVTDKAGVAEGLNKLFALTFMKVFGAHPWDLNTFSQGWVTWWMKYERDIYYSRAQRIVQ